LLRIYIHHSLLFISARIDALKEMKLSDQINASFLTWKNTHNLKNNFKWNHYYQGYCENWAGSHTVPSLPKWGITKFV